MSQSQKKPKSKTEVKAHITNKRGDDIPVERSSQKVETPAKIGAPTIFTQEIADELCEQLALGYSLRTVCAQKNMPAIRTVFNWFRTNEAFLQQYTRAKQEAADMMAEDILDIADDGTNDWMMVQRGHYEGWEQNGEALQRSKLRVDTRKWLMSKMKPKKYGEKMEVDNTHRFVQPILGGASKDDITDDVEALPESTENRGEIQNNDQKELS